MDKQTNINSWDAHLYDDKHLFVTKFGESLVDILQPQEGESILDLGCGTGDLASKIASYDTKVVGVDNSESMILQAQTKYPHLQFQVETALDLPFVQEFDAVFSNAALHWIKQPEQALCSIFKTLKTGGRFVAEFGAKGNIEMITDELANQFHHCGIAFSSEQFPWYFPSIGEYTTLMEEAGFEVAFAQQYSRPTPLEGIDGLRNWLTMFGSSFFTGLTEQSRDDVIAKIENVLKDKMFNHTHWLADYRRIRVIGIK